MLPRFDLDQVCFLPVLIETQINVSKGEVSDFPSQNVQNKSVELQNKRQISRFSSRLRFQKPQNSAFNVISLVKGHMTSLLCPDWFQTITYFSFTF